MMHSSIIGGIPAPLPDYLAWYKFELGTVDHITATIGPDMVATGGDDPVGAMVGGILYNGNGHPYINYANYPLVVAGVAQITIKQLSGELTGGYLFYGSTNGQRIRMESDGSVNYHDNTIGTVDLVPPGTVPFDGSTVDIVLVLPVTIDLVKFCGGGGVWRGSMGELIIEGAPALDSFDTSFDTSFS
jgi:hypothetical protein